MMTPRGFAQRLRVTALAGAIWLSPIAARALDKQGSAHGGEVAGPETGFGLTGSAMFGAALYNPTYAARPDNTGHALLRYAAHADVDLIGHRLSIPLDINFFTDRDRPGALKLVPTELDLIAGVTTTWAAGPGALELGVRAETDRGIQGSSYSQTYVDARTRYLVSLADEIPELGPALDGNITGIATLGVFAINPSYAARPDNSGLALFRYALHAEVSFLGSHAAVGLDATMFTDRHHNPLAPSELDFTPELIGRLTPFEAHLAYERDMPIAEPAAEAATHSPHVQHFVYMFLSWSFEAFPPRNAETRSQRPARALGWQARCGAPSRQEAVR